MTRRTSLFAQVVGLALLAAILTGVAVGLVNLRASRAALETEIRGALLRDANLIREALSERIEAAIGMVSSVAEDGELLRAAPATSSRELGRRLAGADLLASLYVLDPGGTITAVAYHDGRDPIPYLGRQLGEETPADRAIREAVDGAITRPEGAFSRAFRDSRGLPMLVLARRTPDAEYTVTGGFKGSDPRLTRLMESLCPTRGGFVALVDPHLGVLTHAGELPGGADLAALPTGAITSRHGFLMVGALGPRSEMRVVMGIPELVLTRSLAALGREILASTLLAVLLVGLLAALVARRLGTPLHELVRGLAAIREGAYGHRIEATADGELQDAVQAFNEMADRLERTRIIEEVWSETWDE